MTALVVYHSLYGNTARVAEAIAEGIGDGAEAASTADATAARASAASLLVVGSPVHIARLPSRTSMRNAERRPGAKPHAGQPLVRDWLASLPRLDVPATAFDTRGADGITGSAAPLIARRLRRVGCRRVDRPRHFLVSYGLDADGLPVTSLMDGELDRAHAWGRSLALAASQNAR